MDLYYSGGALSIIARTAGGDGAENRTRQTRNERAGKMGKYGSAIDAETKELPGRHCQLADCL